MQSTSDVASFFVSTATRRRKVLSDDRLIQPLTILVVDSEPMILRTVTSMLSLHGHRALAAVSGEEALKICEEGGSEIDLLLTDIHMPEMNGIELARCIAQTHTTLPILFMTGASTETPQMRILLRAQKFRAPKFLRKPFSAKALMKAIDGALISMHSPA